MSVKRKIQYEKVLAKSILNKVTAPSMPFEWSINPYRGCQHGCSFCYARSTHTYLGMEANDTFQNHILIKENAAEVLEHKLRKLAGTRLGVAHLGRVAIGTATDPYQPVEAKERLTRQCLELLADYQVPATITTRSPLVLRDIELFKRIPRMSVNLSINTLDHRIWRNMEPSTPSPQKRLETVRALNAEGINAGIFMAPIIPFLTDQTEDLDELLKAAAEHQAAFIMASFLRLSTAEVKGWFFRTLQLNYPYLMERYGSLYSNRSTVRAEYREPIKKQIAELQRRYGLNGLEPFHKLKVDAVEEPAQLSFLF